MNKKLVLFFALMFTNPVFSLAAGWELYDDFSSGNLDSEKWDNRSKVSTITVENEQLKIIHQAGYPNQSGYLHLIQDRENILGMKATITVTSCTGDVRPRLTGSPGDVEGNRIWSGLQLQPGSNKIYTSTGLESPPPDYTWVTDVHYAQFKQPIDIISNSYVVSMLFGTDNIIYEVEGLGSIIFTSDTTISTATDPWRNIGSRSTNGDGPCTFYVDDVYVQRP